MRSEITPERIRADFPDYRRAQADFGQGQGRIAGASPRMKLDRVNESEFSLARQTINGASHDIGDHTSQTDNIIRFLEFIQVYRKL